MGWIADLLLFQDFFNYITSLRATHPRQSTDRSASATSTPPTSDAAYIYGSWAAAFQGNSTPVSRPVAEIDVLVRGSPDRDKLYAALSAVEKRLGRPVQVTLRPPGWLSTGRGTFHATVTERPVAEIDLRADRPATRSSPR